MSYQELFIWSLLILGLLIILLVLAVVYLSKEALFYKEKSEILYTEVFNYKLITFRKDDNTKNELNCETGG